MAGSDAPLTRRRFLMAVVASAVAACRGEGDGASPSTTNRPSSSTTTSTTRPPVVDADPFVHGVASGDPLDDRVILWTRLAGDLPDRDVLVDWEVALDRDFDRIVAGGTATAVAALGHSVHVDAEGLDADTVHWFRFHLDGFSTPAARTRTFAAAGVMPERFRFAFSSCQHWEHGRWAAYRDVVDRDEIDAFVFLGDYIYESPSRPIDDRSRVSGQDFECTTLDQYRQRYALYRSDPLIQAAHASVPWIVTWDDHEVDNDYAGAVGQDEGDPERFLQRRAAAYQAWYEFMPVRLDPPTGPDLAIHRSFAHGDLVRFHVLDTRQYRSDQQRGEPFLPGLGRGIQTRDETLAGSADQTMLGVDQREWLLTGADQSTATWDVLAQQVFMFGMNAVPGADPPVIVVDTWDGYAGERAMLLDALSRSVDNLVVLTGDFHSAAVADLRSDPFDDALPVIGTEFMASSISSAFLDDSRTTELLVGAAVSTNDHVQWFDVSRGYTHCEVTADRWVATLRTVSDRFDGDSEIETSSRWEILAGKPGAERVS